MDEGLLRALVRDLIKGSAESRGFFTYLEEGGEPSYRRCFDILKEIRVLLVGNLPDTLKAECTRSLGSLYEKLALKLRKEGFRGILEAVSLRRVGKEESTDLSEVDDYEKLKELINHHFVSRYNLFEMTGPPGLETVAGLGEEKDLFSTALFPEKEEAQSSELSSILSDVGFRWYIDWCGDRLGFGKGFLKNLERLPSMTTIELIDLLSKIKRIQSHSEGSKYTQRISEIILILKKVIEKRILSSRSGKRISKDPKLLILEFPEAFSGSERGFDLVIAGSVDDPQGLKTFLEGVQGLLKEEGRVLGILPYEFTYSEEWQGVRKRIRKGILKLNAERDRVVVLFGRSEESKEGGPILILENDRERRVIEEIGEICGATLGGSVIIEKGIRVRRFRSEEGILKGVFPENLTTYRVSGPLEKLSLKKAGEKVVRKADFLAVPKVLVLRRAEYSEIPSPHLKVIGAVDEEGSIPSDGLIALIPRNDSLDLHALAGWINSILFGWILHRLSFNSVSKSTQLSEFYLKDLPLPLHLIGNESFSRIIRDLDPQDSDFHSRFLEAEEEILKSLGFEAENMPLSYRKLLSDPALVKI